MATRITYHAHGCRTCGNRYNDACEQSTEDAQCAVCADTAGIESTPYIIDSWKPRPCCAASRLVTKQEREAYRLAGRSNWHICPTCWRTHPHKPTPEETH